MKKKDKIILNLSALDYGGAGKFALDFHQLLLQGGYQSHMIVKESKTDEIGITQYNTTRFDNPVGKLSRKIRKISWTAKLLRYDYHFYNKYERYSVVSAKKIIELLPAAPDVIFLHWVTDFINAKLIADLKQLTNAKIYWLLIDNAPLTGGCHYPWQCKGFEQDCSSCPAINSLSHQLIAKKNMAFKQKHIPSDVGLITFSNTDYERSKRSTLFGNKQVIKWLAYVDDRRFKPGNRQAARSHFGLTDDKKIILFGAHSLSDKRKGMALLIEAITQLKNANVHLLIAGTALMMNESLPATYTGYLSEQELIIAYQAADMFVCPSLEDSGPIMINQSLMCGTPVVAFDTGVAQDIVISYQTGYKVLESTALSLANGIDNLLELDNEAMYAMSERCRVLAVNSYSRNIAVNRLNNLIDNA